MDAISGTKDVTTPERSECVSSVDETAPEPLRKDSVETSQSLLENEEPIIDEKQRVPPNSKAEISQNTIEKSDTSDETGGTESAKEISIKNKEVIIVEKEGRIGQITSSRNSGVIHAGIYYPSDTLKAKFCVEGNRLLYAYAKKFNVPFINTKKIIVANNQSQIDDILVIKQQAELNGVENLVILDEKQVNKLEPLIKCVGGLLVPSTGIIDQHSLMQSYLGEYETNGGMICLLYTSPSPRDKRQSRMPSSA